MCNLYSFTTNRETIIRLFRQINRYVGDLVPMPGVFPFLWLACLACPAIAADPDINDYSRCVIEEAIRLSKSNRADPTDEIAKSAASLCNDVLIDASRTMKPDSMSAVRSKAFDDAVIAILEARAKR
jgi:hypothetical protein